MPTPARNALIWEERDLPEPPAYSFRNLIGMIGPGVILLSSSIGGGEWLAGPAVAVKYGVQIMWIATVAIVFQVLFNLEGLRYTLYTGEPIYSGFLRLRPGPRFWAPFYCLLAFVQLAWPALAGTAAAAVFASASGRLAGDADKEIIYWIATGLILVTLLILSFGGTIEKMLERASYFMMGFVFLFLLTVNVAFIPASHWWETLTGFFRFSAVSGDLDWSLIAALVATAGSGGMGNLCVTSWARDKGFGMARFTGAIPSVVGGRELKLSPVGKVFPLTPDNLRRWRIWQRFIHADQVFLWGVFAFLGMFLNVNLATGVIPQGTEMAGMAAGAYQAKYMADALWSGFWFLALFNGFWILFSTHLGNTDILIRTVTDIMWVGSPRLRGWLSDNIGRLYYGLLLAFTLWAFVAVRLGEPMKQFKILANVAGFIMILASVQIFLVNRAFLPREIRSRWREAALILCGLFYLFFTLKVIL
jgi:hypothetical protein